MKRRSLCVICLVLYILISCTILSLKIEKEMLTQVEVLKIKDNGVWGQSVSISQTALFEDERGKHLYELVEGSGWESGLRVREIPQDSYELDYEKGTIRLPGGKDYCFIATASRQPVVGELVEIVEGGREQPASDQLLFIYPRGVPEGLEIPADARILERSTNAILVQIENKDMAFFEHKQMGQNQSMAGRNWRVFSMNTVEEFWKQIPLVAVVAGVLLCIILLWLYFCCICPRTNRFGRIFLSAGAASLISISSVYIILSSTDLPAAMLPGANILHFNHYADELRTVCIGLGSLSYYGDGFCAFYNDTITECLTILGSILALTIVLIGGSMFLYRKRRKSNKD